MLSLPDFREKKIVFAVCSGGEKVSFKNDNLIIKDKEGKTLLQMTCYQIFSLFIIGPFLLTSGIIERAKRFGFSIFLMSRNFRVYETLTSETKGNFLLREKQYKNNNLGIAKHLVSNKIHNQLQLLNMLRGEEKDNSTIKQLRKYLHEVAQLKEDAGSLQQLLGWEGISSRIYFQSLFHFLNWKGRKPRVKHDICNVLLDIGYTYLFNIVEALLLLYGFDVYKGIYHQCFYQRKSLVCDLVEPFRVIIDRALRRAFRLKRIEEEDFYLEKHQYKLKYKMNEKYMEIFSKEVQLYREQIFQYIQEFYRSFMRERAYQDYPLFDIVAG